MSEDRVLQALRALAESDREREAPLAVEARLLHEFRTRSSGHKWRWAGIAVIAAGVVLAVSVLAVGLSMYHVKKPVVSMLPPVITIPPPAAPLLENAAPVARKVVRKLARPRAREVVTEFFPLIDSAPPFERGQMLRVQLPAAAMRTVGLPVREDHLADPIQADVLVGEEGMPRAIRFVRFDVQ
jgi:hypothetical protein